MPPTPEQLARQQIDALLTAAGWVIQDMAAFNRNAADGVAVREFGLPNGDCDYLLFVGGKAGGVIEAKKAGVSLSGVAEQATKYMVKLPGHLARWSGQLRVHRGRNLLLSPIIQFHFNWKHVSAIAGLTRSNFLFRLYDGAIRSTQIVEFLKALHVQLRRKLLIVWDGAAQHKSRIVRGYLDSTHGAIQMAVLPPYSPDLNPVESLWAWLKRHALAHFCPHPLTELKSTARRKLRSAQNR